MAGPVVADPVDLSRRECIICGSNLTKYSADPVGAWQALSFTGRLCGPVRLPL
jgi:hypothetical protein